MIVKIEVEESPGQTGTSITVRLHDRFKGQWMVSEQRIVPIGSVSEVEFPSFGYVTLHGPDEEMEDVVQYDPVQKAATVKSKHVIKHPRFIGPTT